jgi:hypothetical protein
MRFGAVSMALVLTVTACVKKAEQPFNGTATVTWAAVKVDTNGKALKDLAGYKIHYGTSPKSMYNVVVLKQTNQTSYVVTDLYPATWYFAVSAYTTHGTESRLSEVVSKTIK